MSEQEVTAALELLGAISCAGLVVLAGWDVMAGWYETIRGRRPRLEVWVDEDGRGYVVRRLRWWR